MSPLKRTYKKKPAFQKEQQIFVEFLDKPHSILVLGLNAQLVLKVQENILVMQIAPDRRQRNRIGIKTSNFLHRPEFILSSRRKLIEKVVKPSSERFFQPQLSRLVKKPIEIVVYPRYPTTRKKKCLTSFFMILMNASAHVTAGAYQTAIVPRFNTPSLN